MENLIPVSLIIADRTYRIKVSADKEETTRKAAKFLNDKITEFKVQYAGKDMQDYVAMVLLWFATESSAELSKALMEADLQDGFDRLEGQIAKALTSSA